MKPLNIRFILSVLVFVFAVESRGHLAIFIDAVRANNLESVTELLAKKDEYFQFVIDINAADSEGRRPIYFAPSAEMLELLFANGAMLVDHRIESHRFRYVYVDDYGMNPLHYLLAFTARNWLSHAKDELAVRGQIERAALTLIRVQYQEIGAGWLRDPTPIEMQKEPERGFMAEDFLPGVFWREDFVSRLSNRHLQMFAAVPEGGFKAAQQRKLAMARKLDLEYQLALRGERQKENATLD